MNGGSDGIEDDCEVEDLGLSPAMYDVVAQRFTLGLCKLWHVFEVVRALGDQGAFLDEVDHVCQAALVREQLCVGHQVFSRDSQQRIADPTSCQHTSWRGKTCTDSPVPAVRLATLWRRRSSSRNKDCFRAGCAIFAELWW